jgi:hypothetical protein
MATTVTDLTTYRKPQRITHYAYLGAVYGTAELLNGSGYLFRAEGERKATLVSYKDPELVLLGRCDVADAQRADEDAAGGLAALVCGYGKGR